FSPYRLLGALHRIRGLGRHVVLVVLGEDFAGAEHAVGAELSLRDHALAFAEQVRQLAAVSHAHALCRVGHRELDVDALALQAAGDHHAADAELRPCGASLAATCEGVKKNTRFFWKALSTSAAAMPSAATPTAIAVMRLCLGFTAFSTTVHQQGNLHSEQEKCNPVGTPHVEPVPAHGKKFS